MRLVLIMILLWCCGGAVAAERAAAPKGFAITDLTAVKIGPLNLHGVTFVGHARPQRIILSCGVECNFLEAIDIQLMKSIDGMEARFRSGLATIDKMEQRCRESEPTCTMSRVDLAGAVGWVSRTVVLGTPTSTTVLFKGEDRLVIRSIAGTVQTAFDNGAAIRDRLALQIIGR